MGRERYMRSEGLQTSFDSFCLDTLIWVEGSHTFSWGTDQHSPQTHSQIFTGCP